MGAPNRSALNLLEDVQTMKHTLTLALLVSASSLQAQESTTANILNTTTHPEWGVGIGFRSATIPFQTGDDTVHDVLPLLFYQGENFYLDGFSGGYKFGLSDNVSAGPIAQIRFFDIPRNAQNTIQGTQLDVGGNMTWHYSDSVDFKFDVLSDHDGRVYSLLTSEYKLSGEDWSSSMYASLRAKSSRFNNTYYGLQTEDLGAQIDYQIGFRGRKQIYQNLYAVGHLGATIYDHETYSSQYVDSHGQLESYLGIAMFGSANTWQQPELPKGAYMRVAHGIATQSGPFDIFLFDNETDPHRNSMTSVFYGHPLNGTVFNLPIDFYLTPGYVQHHSSDVQGTFGEYVMAIKGYYTFNWPVRSRLGFAEGVSYSTQISHIERESVGKHDYEPSKLMNYLDFSYDVNLGDVFNNSSIKDLWLGYSLHHRSGIFTSTSAFGRIKGGSDYNSIYLQWHF